MQVLHSGIPVTLIPLDATNTIPVSENFFNTFEQNQNTNEAKYCFQSLKLAHDTWYDDRFHEVHLLLLYLKFYNVFALAMSFRNRLNDILMQTYFMWDSFMVGVAISTMRSSESHFGENEFAEMEFVNITVVTSNKPYGISNGSNPFFVSNAIPKFQLQKNGVHSGHVQTGMRDPFCLVHNGDGRCEVFVFTFTYFLRSHCF